MISERLHLPQGEIELILWDEHGIHEHRLHKNLIVNAGAVLLAGMLMGASGTTLTHLAIGRGVGNGTQNAPESAKPSATQLREEAYRTPLTTATYADLNNASGLTVVRGERSNKVIFAAELGVTGLGTVPITEAGLFGGANANARNGGEMFNWVVFPVINKPDAMNLTFRWSLTFPVQL